MTGDEQDTASAAGHGAPEGDHVGSEPDDTIAAFGASARRRRPWIGIGAAVTVAAVLAGIIALSWRAPEAEADAGDIDVETSMVTVGDLVEQARQSGELGYGPTRELGGGLPGTVTSMAQVGTIVGRGQELYRIDDRPVMLLIGDLPAWRAFSPGMGDGADVLQLEQNLQALGYFDDEPDEEFDWDTESAIDDWQEALGLEETGTLELGRVVFSSNDVRVAEQLASIGGSSGAAALSVTGTAKVVTVDIDPSLVSFAPVGGSVSVSLPDGTTASATITASGTPVERDDGLGGTKLKVPLTLVLDDPDAGGSLSEIRVTVTIRHVLAEDVVLVPVLALLARPGGGFAVERVTPRGTELVDVELGAIADGFAEISSGDLGDGDEVVVGS